MTKNELGVLAELVDKDIENLDTLIKLNQELNKYDTSNIPRSHMVRDVYTKKQILENSNMFEDYKLFVDGIDVVNFLEYYNLYRVDGLHIIPTSEDDIRHEVVDKQTTIVYHYLNLWIDNHDELEYIELIPDNIKNYFFKCKMNELKRVTLQTLNGLGGTGANDERTKSYDEAIEISIDELEKKYQWDYTKWLPDGAKDDNRKDVI